MPQALRLSPGQRSLDLVEPARHLAELDIPAEWKAQQRLWGHSFHPMCSYLAMFPAGLAHAFIGRYSRPGDVVLDPFSGRGTTALQACAEGRIGVGVDLNPMAQLLTAAKVDPPSRAALSTRLAMLRLRWSAEAPRWRRLADAALQDPGPGGLPVPPAGGAGVPAPLPREVALAFHPTTLAQLLMVREALQTGVAPAAGDGRIAGGRAPDGPRPQGDPIDRFLAAALLGILHGRSKSYLSDLMPNSFSMAPRYVRDYVARTGFQPTERDLFACLDAKIQRLFRQPPPEQRGIGLLGDARHAAGLVRGALSARALPERARLVITSPPYLRVVKYGYYNWLRLWFLGVDPGAVDATLDDAHQLEPYLAFLRDVLADLREALTDDAVVAFVVGDVELDRGRPLVGGVGLAETVWSRCAEPEGYRLAGVVVDDIATHRKLTRLWGAEAGRATKVDRLLVMSPTELGRRRALAGARLPVDWTWPRDRLRTI